MRPDSSPIDGLESPGSHTARFEEGGGKAYVLPLIAVTGAALLRGILDPLAGESLPFPTFYLAVIVSAWLGGLRAGLIATVASLFVAWYFFVPPRHTFLGTPGAHLLALLMYVLVNLAIVFTGESLRRAGRVEARELHDVKSWPDASLHDLLPGARGAAALGDVAVVGFLLTLLSLVLGGALGYVSTRRLIKNEQVLTSSHARIAEVKDLISTLKDAETGQRGYLLTRDEAYLAPYKSAVSRLRDVTARVHALGAANSGEQEVHAALEQKITAKLEEMERTVQLTRSGDSGAAIRTVRENTGQVLMDGIRKDVAALEDSGYAILKQRSADSRESARITLLVNVLGSSMGIGLLAGLFYLSRRNLRIRRIALTALLEQRERLRVTLSSIGDAVISTDVEGRVTYLNEAAESLTRWKLEEAQGQPLETVFPIFNEESLEPAENPVKKALREGKVVGLANHTVLLRRDGSRLLIDDSAAPIKDTDGKIVGVVMVFHDIEDRRRAEEGLAASGRRFQLAAEALQGVICEYDLASDRVERTLGLLEVVGYRPEEAPSTAAWWREQIHPEDLEAYLKGMEEAAKGGKSPPFVYRLRHRDGSWIHLEDRAVLLDGTDGNAAKVITCAIDITKRKVAEEALRDSERRTRQFLEYQESVVANMGEGLYAIDLQGRVSYINPTAERLLGYKKGELIGAKMHDATHYKRPDGTPFPVEECAGSQVLHTGNALTDFDDIFIRKDGSFMPVSYSSTPLRSGARIAGLVVVFRDMTKHSLAEESLRYQTDLIRSITENATTAIFLTDAEGKTTFMNPAAEAMTGYKLEEARGSVLQDLVHAPETIHSETDAPYGAVPQIWEEGSAMRDHEDLFVRKDGQLFPVLCNARPIQIKGRTAATVIEVRDITQEKLSEQRVYGLLSELRDTDRRKNEFLATLAHELRNPLAPIRHSLEIMKRGQGNPPLLEQARSTMERQVGHMVRLIDDLLDVNRITRNTLELKMETVELGQIIEHAVEACRPLSEASNQKLQILPPARPIHLHADAVRLVQIFVNLLTNACKYTERDGEIRLAVEEGETHVVVSVSDSGIGIPRDMLPRVFDLFTQIDRSLERSQGGLGIGLALVKRLVEMHDGTVTADSDGPGQGSELRVRLPVLVAGGVPTPAPPPSTPASEPATSPPIRILVVDDNVDSALSLTTLLGMSGNETIVAHSGDVALDLAERHRPQFILLDIGLPGLSGYEVCRAIRKEPWGRATRIVALTGWGQEEDRRKSREAGFDAHLVKPVDHARLLQLLAESMPKQA